MGAPAVTRRDHEQPGSVLDGLGGTVAMDGLGRDDGRSGGVGHQTADENYSFATAMP